MIGYHLQTRLGTIHRHDWVPSTDNIGYNPHTRLGTIHRHDWVPSTDKIGYQLQTQYMNKHLLNAQWLTTITVIFKTKLQ